MNEGDFIEKLIEKYGEWKKESAQFGNTSYGDIASDLCYSNSHFSKLISGNGSEAMYVRAIKNLEQQITAAKWKEKALELEHEQQNSNLATQWFSRKRLLLFLLLAIPLFLIVFWAKDRFTVETQTTAYHHIHPLDRYFNPQQTNYFRTPFLNIGEVHSFCPCSAYEGVWSLAAEYKMPLPSNRPGLYYVARSADIRMKCQKSADERGLKLLGFENIQNEIWIDKTRKSFTPTYFNTDTKSYTPEFENLKFEENENFVKIADVYSCFFDEFTIMNDSIFRKGEPCGRYAEIANETIVEELQIDIDDILNNIIGKMTSTNCASTINNYCNPNDIKEGETIFSFDCLFSINTENLGFGGGYPYSKGYKLIEQNYSSNLLCDCEMTNE